MKVHLLLSPTPVERGSRQTGLCGAEIEKCQRIYSFGNELRISFEGTKGICRKCMDAYWKADIRGRVYLFGLTEQPENKPEESELYA